MNSKSQNLKQRSFESRSGIYEIFAISLVVILGLLGVGYW
jgi:hypothetical protein